MVNSCHPKVGSNPSKVDLENVSAEGHQQLSVGLLQNLNQFLVTQTQLMRQMIQLMATNNASSSNASCKHCMAPQAASVPEDRPEEPKAPNPQAPCHYQDTGHKRKTEEQVQDIVKISKTRGIVGPSFQSKASPDNLPEVTLIATITPAAGRKANARIMSQIQEYRRLGLLMPQDEAVKHPTGSSTSKPPIQGQPRKKQSQATGITCFFCQEIGHYANKCSKKQQAKNSAIKQQLQRKTLCCPPLLSSLSESRGRDSLKGGRFVTS